MDTLSDYRNAIKQIFAKWREWPGPQADFVVETVIDEVNGHYMLVYVGWSARQRVHGTLVHIDIINGKIWIQEDQTDEGVADDLVAAGVPKDKIVLGFKSEERRRMTEFAVA